MTTPADAPDPAATATPPPRDPFAAHVLDLDATQAGVWVRVRGDEFLVATMDNDRIPKIRAAWLAERGLPPGSAIPKDQYDNWAAHVFARGILLDARFKDAPDVAYSHQMGERISFDPKLANLYADLLARARGDWSVAAIDHEVTLGNLRRCSPGSASVGT